LVTARFFGEVFERFRQPAMIGEILAGMLIGPSFLNLIHRSPEIKVISELGVFLLVIIAGLEISIEDVLKSLRGKNLIISVAAFFIPFFSGIAIASAFNMNTFSALFVGLCVAITALPVSIRILMDIGQLKSDIGQRIISAAIFDDVLALTVLGILIGLRSEAVPALSIINVVTSSLSKLALFIVTLGISYYLIRRISRQAGLLEEILNKSIGKMKGKESLFALFFVFILIFATFSESLGLHFIVGAFFASMLIDESLIGHTNLKTIESTTRSLAMGFLAPIFFAGIGLEFNVSTVQNYSLLLAILAVSFGSKILGGLLGGKLAGMSWMGSFTLGMGLNARGIMGLVIANIAYKAEMLSIELFSVLVIMSVATTLSTALSMKSLFTKQK
jgi:Kef-type K+ transport system membrane component KefB